MYSTIPSSSSSRIVPCQLSPGTVLWLLEYRKIEQPQKYGLEERACNHPCVIIGNSTLENHVKVCTVTSLGGRSVAEVRKPEQQVYYISIYPNKPNPRTSPSQVSLTNGHELPKLSYIYIERVYELPLTFLRNFDRALSRDHYQLTPQSLYQVQTILRIPRLHNRPTSKPSTFPVISSSRTEGHRIPLLEHSRSHLIPNYQLPPVHNHIHNQSLPVPVTATPPTPQATGSTNRHFVKLVRVCAYIILIILAFGLVAGIGYRIYQLVLRIIYAAYAVWNRSTAVVALVGRFFSMTWHWVRSTVCRIVYKLRGLL